MMDPSYLSPGFLVESDDPLVVAFARQAQGDFADQVSLAVNIYQRVRDQVIYDPYVDFADPKSYSAKEILARRRGFCIPKAALLAACARAVNIPARLGFADVRNHLASPRLIRANQSNLFRWHAYTELFLEGKWVKATPAFDRALCARCAILPLDFDGRRDSIFHPFDQKNQKHMDYVLERGLYADVPFTEIVATWRQESPGLFEEGWRSGAQSFLAEAMP
ncbi:MAG TPA: transglutaminase family protein [Rhodospirillaceae bacterium]|nr:transglutaminase family protein [Rhodospirillaceae bacterium]